MGIPRFSLTEDYSVSRIIKGGWHLAGGHGKIDKRQAVNDMRAFVEAGITTFDCADIYTGVEELIGQFLGEYKAQMLSGELEEVQVHTKYVPDYDSLADLKKEDVTQVIDRSLKRLGVERLDLVQFAWWDYQFPGYIETCFHLAELQQEGKIRYLGVTNFDTNHVQDLASTGLKIVSNQVQYSVIDRRVAFDEPETTKQLNIPLLCYGSMAGGFLSDLYLNKREPQPPFENRSLTKYKLILEEFGTWDLYQQLLRVLNSIAEKYQVGIGEIAGKYVLQQPGVGSIVVGARNTKHLQGLKSLGGFNLDSGDLQQIQKVLDLSSGPTGPFYELERDKEGRHGAIMKYNLNREK